MSELSSIVLAAGLGKRMKSRLPKVLHPVAGFPLVHYPVRAALEVGAREVVVVVSPQTRDAVERDLTATFGRDRIRTAVQHPPRGTGDAARAGLTGIDTDQVLILCGDTPLLTAADLGPLAQSLEEHPHAVLTVLSCVVEDPGGYGRVLRDSVGHVASIREHRDCTREERSVREVNAGVYAARTQFLRAALDEITPSNAQGEYYLTDAVALAARTHGALAVLGNPDGLVGVNDRWQLAEAEASLFARHARLHAAAGVTVHPTACIEAGVRIEPDVRIGAGAHLRGQTRIGTNVLVDAGCVLVDAVVGEGSHLAPYTVIDGCTVAARTRTRPHQTFDGAAPPEPTT